MYVKNIVVPQIQSEMMCIVQVVRYPIRMKMGGTYIISSNDVKSFMTSNTFLRLSSKQPPGLLHTYSPEVSVQNQGRQVLSEVS